MEPVSTNFGKRSWTSSMRIFYLLPQSVPVIYLQILQRFAGRHMIGVIRQSTLPSVHWETGYCIRALEKGGTRESLVEKHVLSMSTEFNIKIKVTAPCSKTSFSKELENKERLLLNFFTSLQHHQAKWKANGKHNVGLPSISLQHFCSVADTQKMSVLCCTPPVRLQGKLVMKQLISVAGNSTTGLPTRTPMLAQAELKESAF